MEQWNKIGNPETDPGIYESFVQNRAGTMNSVDFIDSIGTNDYPNHKIIKIHLYFVSYTGANFKWKVIHNKTAYV